MTQIIGWTPSSHGADPGTSSLSLFIGPFGMESIENNQDFPAVRSGHRCFTDNDYFYVIGGYTDLIDDGSIFKELWAMSLTTFEWRRYETKGELPETLASFAMIQTYPFSKSFILFGGSGTVFGSSSSNSFYLVSINNNDCTIESRKLDVQNTVPQPVYGHAMCAGEVPGKYYIIGGTEGMMFNFDVHALTMKVNPHATDENEKFLLSCELISRNLNYSGRYRLEATYDEMKHSLVFFGGGNSLEVFGFETMIVLDLTTKETTDAASVPDADFGFPPARRCHTIARHGRKVVMTGGLDHTIGVEYPVIYSDVWTFDLDNFSWRKYDHSLPKPVFFHDSAMTEDGWMLSFGGVHQQMTPAPRNNVLHGAWFGVPTLQRFSLESLRSKYPKMFTGLYCGNLRMSDVIEVFNVFCKKGNVEEKEREIIEDGQIKFHEKGDRARYFVNADYKEFAIKHGDMVNRRRLRRERVRPRQRNDQFREVLQRLLQHFGNNDRGDEEESNEDESTDEEAEENQDPENNGGEPNARDDENLENRRFMPWR